MTVISWTIAGNLRIIFRYDWSIIYSEIQNTCKISYRTCFLFCFDSYRDFNNSSSYLYSLNLFYLTCFAPFIFRYLYKLDDGHYEFSENENELSKLSLANFVIENTIDENFIENIKK